MVGRPIMNSLSFDTHYGRVYGESLVLSYALSGRAWKRVRRAYAKTVAGRAARRGSPGVERRQAMSHLRKPLASRIRPWRRGARLLAATALLLSAFLSLPRAAHAAPGDPDPGFG